MARRRRPDSGSSSKIAILLFALALGAGAWWYWQRGGSAADGQRDSTPASTATDGSEVIQLPAPEVPVDALCAKLGDPRVATLLQTSAVTTTPLPSESGVPRAAACRWVTAEGGELVAMWFNNASLARGNIAERGAAYFQTTATGIEYALKSPAEKVAGIGEEAVVGGFATPDSGEGQVIVRRGEHVLAVSARAVPRAATLRLAEALIAQF